MSSTTKKLTLVRDGQPPPPPPPKEPDKDILRLCEELLRRAKLGEIRSLGVAADMTDDTSLIRFEVSPPFNGLIALGNAHKLCSRIDIETESEDA